MKKFSNLSYFFVSVVFFIFVNSYFSNMIVKSVENGAGYSNDFINIICIKNTGAAFSILQNSTNALIIISFLAIIFMLVYLIKNLEAFSKKGILAFSLLFAGILGNLYERVLFGYVRDFFDLTFVNFPVFNISDMYINIGVFVIIIYIILTKRPIKFL